MDPTVSVSKGCFVFKPKDEKKGKRKKYHDVLDFSSTFWYNSYSTLWKKIEVQLEKLNKTISDVVLHDLESYISSSNVLTKTIHTAVLLMGVNLPDHHALFVSLASRLQNHLTPHVALLQSDDCTTVKYAIEQMVAQFLKRTKILDEDEMMDIDYDSSDSEEEVANIKRSDCTLVKLVQWYKENDDDKKLVVILKDFEGFSCNVLEDFILILSQYSTRLPIILVMGVATTASALHRTLSHNVTSQLNIRIFQSKPSVYFLNNTLDNVFIKSDCPFQLGTKLFKFLTDIFLYYDFSVDGFIKGMKYCIMDHFHSSPTSILCCSPSELDKVADSLTKDHMKEFQTLQSFQVYYNKLSKQKQTSLKSSNKEMKELLKKLMQELWENLSLFHLLIRLLHVLVADLPNSPLGKQVREIYAEAISNRVTNSTSFGECFKILGFIAKDELLQKLNKMVSIIDEMPKNDQILDIKNQLNDFVVRIQNVGYELLNSTPTKSPSKEKFNITSRAQFRQHLEKMSQNKPKNAYEATRLQLLDYLKNELFEKLLLPITCLPLHEVILLDNLTSVKRHIIGTPRASIHTALNNPHHYLQCDCCKLSNDSEILPTMPDISIAYKLHLESSSLINMYDWLQSFAIVIDPEHAKHEQKDVDSHIQARFTQAVAELQFLGFIKSSKKKTDHVTRLTWGGSV